MSVAAFDALRIARRLQGAGFTPEQAAGFAEAFAETMVTDLATKADLAELRAELRAEFRLECERLRTDIAASRSEVIRWVVPLVLAQMALTIGIILRMPG